MAMIETVDKNIACTPQTGTQDVADWQIKMASGEFIRVKGVLIRGEAEATIYEPGSRGQSGVLFNAAMLRIDHILRVRQTLPWEAN
jgi:hypothetical protein